MATNGTSNGGSKGRFTTTSTIPLWLDGKEVTTGTTFDVISPVTNKKLYSCAGASEKDALAAVASCEKAFPAWRDTKPSARRDIFLKAAAIFEARTEECHQYLREETGVEPPMFGFQYAAAVDACKSLAGLSIFLAGSAPTVAEEGQSAVIYKEPYGVVLGIAPWNAPYVLGLRAFLQPLATGNTVILKGPELSPGTFWALASVFHEAGLPAGCLNTIYHRPGEDAVQVTNALISSPVVKKVSFTGSTNTGSIIASLCGKYVKPCLMELGGKAPTIICEDANLQVAGLQCAVGSFLHSGQICMSAERILVHKSIVEPFKEAFKGAVEAVFGGKDREAPILVNGPPVEKNKKLLKDAVSKGAKVVYGDVDAAMESKTRMRPVVVENVKEDMDIYYTESFGPTVSLFTFEEDEEAIRVANDTEYGLSSAVFTEDLRRGFKIAKQIESGAVHINSMTVHDETALPHGGAKKSGFGRFNGMEGLNEWVRTKTITWKD